MAICRRTQPKISIAEYARVFITKLLPSIKNKRSAASVVDDQATDALAELSLNAMLIAKYGKCNHFFVEHGVAEFCENSTKTISSDYFGAIPSVELVKRPNGWPYQPPIPTPEFSDVIGGGFFFHFPVIERRKSLMVMPLSVITVDNERMRLNCAVFDGTSVIPLDSALSVGAEDLRPDLFMIGRLVFGLSLYMDAFPDAVIGASSDDIIQPGHYTGGRKIIGRTEVVGEDERHSVSPHWRRGHFRMLNSERFVKKQGMTVFVKGTFVKGRAFDVLADAPPVAANA
jgi:hypothetical protein